MSRMPESVDAIKQELEAIRKSASTAISIYDTTKSDTGDRNRASDYANYVRS